jgi:hypothetical protein
LSFPTRGLTAAPRNDKWNQSSGFHIRRPFPPRSGYSIPHGTVAGLSPFSCHIRLPEGSAFGARTMERPNKYSEAERERIERKEDNVVVNSDESFPASDPPSFNPGVTGAPQTKKKKK